METIDRSFLGTGWNFPPSFRREWYGVEMLSGEDDIRSSIGIILSTIPGERVMLPNFGCNLQPYVFDTMNPANTTLIEKIVHDALVFHEPRIIVGDITTTADQELGVLNIDIQYTVIATNTRYNYVYPFYINEATNVDR
jgi:phage baseplate assembly protein W